MKLCIYVIEVTELPITSHSTQGCGWSESSVPKSKQDTTTIRWVASAARKKGFVGPVQERREAKLLCEIWHG